VLPVVNDAVTLMAPTEEWMKNNDAAGAIPAAERLQTFHKKLYEGIEEAKILDSALNVSFNLGVDVEEKPVDALEVVTEGYLHTKFLVLDDSVVMDAKTARRAWDAHKEGGRTTSGQARRHRRGQLAPFRRAGGGGGV
jgi:hypothetical protein